MTLSINESMNTVSLVLNGRIAADIAFLPDKYPNDFFSTPKAMSSTTTLSRQSHSPPASRSGSSTPRPWSRSGSSTPTVSRRSSSNNSAGWYTNTENALTLEEFGRRLNTRWKRFEIWQGRCAQNVVMALLRPTPLILFALNPVCLILYVLVGCWWFAGRWAEA